MLILGIITAVLAVGSLAVSIGYQIYMNEKLKKLQQRRRDASPLQPPITSDDIPVPLVLGRRTVGPAHPVIFANPVTISLAENTGNSTLAGRYSYYAQTLFNVCYANVSRVYRIWYTKDKKPIFDYADPDLLATMQSGYIYVPGNAALNLAGNLYAPIIPKGITYWGYTLDNFLGGFDKDGGMGGGVSLRSGTEGMGQGTAIQELSQAMGGVTVPNGYGFFQMALTGLGAFNGHWFGYNPYLPQEWFLDVFADGFNHGEGADLLPPAEAVGILTMNHIETQTVPYQLLELNPAKIAYYVATMPAMRGNRDPATIDIPSFEAAGAILETEGFGLSLLSNNYRVGEILDDIAEHVDGTFREDLDGKLQFVLNRRIEDTGSLLVLDETNVIQVRKASRATTGGLPKTLVIKYWSQWEEDFIGSYTVDAGGSANPVTHEFMMASTPGIAGRIGNRILGQMAAPLLHIDITATREAYGLLRGDAFVFVWPQAQIPATVMRVHDIEYGSHDIQELRIVAVEDNSEEVSFTVDETEPPIYEGETPSIYSEHVSTETPYYFLVVDQGQNNVDSALASQPTLGYVTTAGPNENDPDPTGFTPTWDSEQPEPSGVPVGNNGPEGLLVYHNKGGEGLVVRGYTDFAGLVTLSGEYDRVDTVLTYTDILSPEKLTGGRIALWEEELVELVSQDTIGLTVTVNRAVLDSVPVAHTDGTLKFLKPGANIGTYTQGQSVAVRAIPRNSAGEADVNSVEAAALETTVVLDQRAYRPYPPAWVNVNGSPYDESPAASYLFTWFRRNRKIADQVYEEEDADQTPEVGQTTRIRVYGEGLTPGVYDELIREVSLIAGTSYHYTADQVEEDAPTTAGDDLWDFVESLQHMDSLTDAVAGRTWTQASSDVAFNSADSYFAGGASLACSGVGNLHHIYSDSGGSGNIPTGGVTFDVAFKTSELDVNTHPYQHVFVGSNFASTTQSVRLIVDYNGYLAFHIGNTEVLVSPIGAIAVDTWYHVTIQRDDTLVWTMWIDGQFVVSKPHLLTSPSGNCAIFPLYVGGTSTTFTDNASQRKSSTVSKNNFIGRIDELRVTIGTERYDTSYVTPPSGELTYTANSVIASDFSTGWGDQSGRTWVPTFATHTSLSTAVLHPGTTQVMYGDGFASFSPAEDSGAEVPASTDFELGDDWVINLSVYRTDSANSKMFAGTADNPINGGWLLGLNSAGDLIFESYVAGVLSVRDYVSASFATGQWYQFSVVCENKSIRLYVDGVLTAGDDYFGQNITGNLILRVGNDNRRNGFTPGQAGYFSRFRIINNGTDGEGNINFTPPTEPYPGGTTIAAALRVLVDSQRSQGEFAPLLDSRDAHEFIFMPSENIVPTVDAGDDIEGFTFTEISLGTPTISDDTSYTVLWTAPAGTITNPTSETGATFNINVETATVVTLTVTDLDGNVVQDTLTVTTTHDLG